MTPPVSATEARSSKLNASSIPSSFNVNDLTVIGATGVETSPNRSPKSALIEEMSDEIAFLKRGFGFSVGIVGLIIGVGAKRMRSRTVKGGVASSTALPSTLVAASKQDGDAKKAKAAVNSTFLRQFGKLVRVLIPRVFSAEMFYTAMVGVFLIVRTLADVWMITNATKIEKSIITRNGPAFLLNVFKYISLMIPISFVNQGLKYGLNEMSLLFRVRLTEHIYKKYMQGITFYRLSNLDGRIDNVDQLLTNDVQKFCESVVELYSNLSKPILDVLIYSAKLTSSHGAGAPGAMLAYLVAAGALLTAMRRPVARLTAIEQECEGDFRFVNSRLITNSEEISFYQGNRTELNVLQRSFGRLVDQIRKSIEFRFSMGVVDNVVAKYFATVVGFYVVSRPYLSAGPSPIDAMSPSEAMEEYYRSGRMLVSLASAVGRIVLAGRELTRLSAYTARVADLLDKVTMMSTKPTPPFVVREDANSEKSTLNEAPSDVVDRARRELDTSLRSQLAAWRERAAKRTIADDALLLAPSTNVGGKVVVERDACIEFSHADIVSPDGKLLVRDLTFTVKRGVNCMVSGPNGAGKSSLFRVIGGLWPLNGGQLVRPPLREILFVPQKPYLVIGTLRANLIYPHSVEQMRAAGVTDDDLKLLLSIVDPAGNILKEWRFDDVRDWQHAFSGGQKQRVAMARLFYHRPAYAILDECTSAVSDEVEDKLYQTCKELGITLFTVSHRKSLQRHHDLLLTFKGGIDGAWSVEQLSSSSSTAAVTPK